MALTTEPTRALTDVDKTSRDTTTALVGVGSVVIIGSAWTTMTTFQHLGESGALGIVTALAVDLALAVWFRISQRLRGADITVPTGTLLEGTTLAMTLYGNAGAALFRGINPGTLTARVCLTIEHCFLPVVLFLVSLAGAQAHRKLAALRRTQEAHEASMRDAERTAERVLREREQQKAIREQELVAETAHTMLITQREKHDHETRLLVGTLASLMYLAVPRRTRPSPVYPTCTRPSRTQPVYPTDPTNNLALAREYRASRLTKGLPFNRHVLRDKLGCTDREARALIAQLGTEPALRVVPNGREVQTRKATP
jgi:hypothetical protein